MEPTGDEEAEASKVVGEPGEPGTEVKAAVVAWSGVMAMPSGVVPGVMVAPAVFVAVAIGITVPIGLTAYAVLPSGVTAMAFVLPPTGMTEPAVLVAVSIGVTLLLPMLVT